MRSSFCLVPVVGSVHIAPHRVHFPSTVKSLLPILRRFHFSSTNFVRVSIRIFGLNRTASSATLIESLLENEAANSPKSDQGSPWNPNFGFQFFSFLLSKNENFIFIFYDFWKWISFLFIFTFQKFFRFHFFSFL